MTNRGNAKVRGFDVEVVSDYGDFRIVEKAMWKKRTYIAMRVEFGASPIRDKASLEKYCKLLDDNGLKYVVFGIQ